MRGAIARIRRDARALLPRVARALSASASALRAVIGAPDYDGYVAHLRATRPDATPPSRAEFVDARLRARYERPGARCC